MEDFDEGRFVLTGPPWVAVDRLAIDKDPDTGETFIEDPRGIKSGVNGNRRYVVFFTDQDLAERFIASQDPLNLVPRCLPHMPTVIRILEDLRAGGYTDVVFDAVKEGQPAQVIPIDDFLTLLRERQQSKDDSDEEE